MERKERPPRAKFAAKAVIAVSILLAIIIVVGLLRGNFRSGELKIGNSSAKVQTQDPQPGISVEDAISKNGELNAVDETGRGVEAKRVNAEGDIILKNTADPKP